MPVAARHCCPPRPPNPEQATPSHIKALQQLGYTVTLTPTT